MDALLGIEAVLQHRAFVEQLRDLALDVFTHGYEHFQFGEPRFHCHDDLGGRRFT
jgi:hypothetical protein